MESMFSTTSLYQCDIDIVVYLKRHILALY